MGRGILYGVGVGPGDPKLMTLRAVEVIRDCPVVAAPRTRGGGTAALEIARAAIAPDGLEGKEILPLDFAMSRDAAERGIAHRAAADALRARLDAGLSVALLNLGDVSVYATFQSLAGMLAPEGYRVEMIAGVPSFCAAAAALGESLTAGMGMPLRVVPDGGGGADDAGGGVDFFAPGTTVWMKSGRGLLALLRALEEAGAGERAAVVQNCGMAGERVYRSAGAALAAGIEAAYFTVVILKNGVPDNGGGAR